MCGYMFVLVGISLPHSAFVHFYPVYPLLCRFQNPFKNRHFLTLPSCPVPIIFLLCSFSFGHFAEFLQE